MPSTAKLRYALDQLVPPLAHSLWQALKKPAPAISKYVFDEKLDFSIDWFSENDDSLVRILGDLQPSKVIEIGSLEGMSTAFFVEQAAVHRPLEIHAIDTWEGGIEHRPGGHAPLDMGAVEHRFRANLEKCVRAAPYPVDLQVHKCPSHQALARLIVDGREGQFDLIFIDGSHQAPDVLADATLAMKLLRVGGVIAFDDYLWEEPLAAGTDPLRCPKPAIDAFVNINIRKLNVLRAPLRRLYVRKVAE